MDSQATSLDLAQAATRSAANASSPVLRGAIRARQLDVLQMQLTHPGYFNQRRVDTLAEVGVGHTYWLCSHQISLSGLLAEVDEKDLRRQRQTRTLTLPPSPEAAGDQTTAGVVSEHGAGMVDITGVTPDSYVLSVGIFRKERLPDLSVVDERGECVPVLSRREQAEWLAAVFTQSVRQIAELKNDTASAITERFQRVIGCDDEAAQTELESLKAALNELFKTELQPEGGDTEALHLADQVEDILRPLCAYTHVLVRVRPNTTGAVQLRVMFTRGIDLPNLRTWLDGDAPGESRGARFQALWAHLLQRLALTSTPIPLKLDGANHSQSFYLLAECPSGLEVRHLYWRELKPRAQKPEAPTDCGPWTYETVASKWNVLGCYHPEYTAGTGACQVEVGIAGHGLHVVLALAVASLVLLFALATQAREGVPKDIRDVVALAAVVPGALLGFATRRFEELTAQIAKWLRRLIGIGGLLLIVVGATTTFWTFSQPGGRPPGKHDLPLSVELSFSAAAGALAVVTVLLVYLSMLYPRRKTALRGDPRCTAADTLASRRGESGLASLFMVLAVLAGIACSLAMWHAISA